MLTLAAAVAASAFALAPSAADAQRPHGQRYERGYEARPQYLARPRFDRRQDRPRVRRCNVNDGGGVIAAIAGGLSGSSVAGRGGPAGRPIDRSGNPRRCR